MEGWDWLGVGIQWGAIGGKLSSVVAVDGLESV